MGLLFIPFRTIWDGTNQVTYFVQTILFVVIAVRSFRLVEPGLSKKVHCRVLRVMSRKAIVDRTLFGKRWLLLLAVTHLTRVAGTT